MAALANRPGGFNRVSIRRILAALETTDLPANEKLLLILLADHADDETGKCWPSQNYIASRSGLARSTINRTIKRLEGKSLIQMAEIARTLIS